jgi:hypothetical protein
MNYNELSEVIQENVQDGLSPFDLDRIKVPAGGGISWEVETLEGTTSVKDLDGVIIYWKDNRAYWRNKFSGENSPPDCYSDDGRFGFGNPGGECSECPNSQFGSAIDEKGEHQKGQACKAMRMIFVIGKDSVLPSVITVPPTSLKSIKQYFLRLASKGVPYYGVVSRFNLEKAKSGAGVTYSRIIPSVASTLNREQIAAMKSMSESLRSVLSMVRATRDADENCMV